MRDFFANNAFLCISFTELAGVKDAFAVQMFRCATPSFSFVL